MTAAVAAGARPMRAGHAETPTGPTVRASGGRITLVAERQDNTADDRRILDHIRAYTTVMTAMRAAQILSQENFALQRTISPKHVAYLLSAIEVGELTELSLAFGEMPNGARRLVDGQHRLKALAESGRTLPASITVIRVMNDRELAALYAKYDRQRSRTPEEMLRAFGIYERTKLSPTILNRIGRAVTIVDANFSRSYNARSKSMIGRTTAVEAWLPYGEQLAEHLSGSTEEVAHMLWRAPVAAVGLATVRYQPDVAESFWRIMAAEDGLTRDDPRAQLLRWLRANRVAASGSTIVYSRHVAGAWNAHYQGRRLDRIMIRDRSAPVTLLGTPYGSEQLP